jgi:hypothetical protein
MRKQFCTTIGVYRPIHELADREFVQALGGLRPRAGSPGPKLGSGLPDGCYVIPTHSG